MLIRIELPIEIGKSYEVDYNGKSLFHVTDLNLNGDKDKILGVKGIYDHNKEMGECYISPFILVPEVLEFEE